MNGKGSGKAALGELLALAVPSSAFVLLTHGYRVVDQFWVDRISVAAQAAVGSTLFVLVVAFASFEVLSAGAGPLLARATGGGDDDGRRRVLGAALRGGFGLAAVFFVGGALGADGIARSLGLDLGAQTEAARYLRALALTSLPLVLTPLIDVAFLALGDARTPLALHGVALGLNLVLTPLFALGLDGGVTGAALASTLSRAVATAWGLHRLSRRIGLRRADVLNPGWRRELARIGRIGAPMALSTALYGGVYWVLVAVAVSPLGPEVNAALGIGWSALEGLAWPVFHGVALAVASVVGRRLGAGDVAGARRAAAISLLPTAALGLVATGLFVAGGELLTAPFASDPAVRREAALYAAIIGLSQLFVALESTAEGVLAGAGATRSVFWTSAPLNLLRAPLAWWVAIPLGAGAAGIWWVITGTTVVKAGLKLILLVRGRWALMSLDDRALKAAPITDID